MTEGLDADAHLLQSRRVALHPFRVAGRELECLREEQSLRRNTLLFHATAQLFKQDPFVRCVLIDEDEAVLVFHQDIELV